MSSNIYNIKESMREVGYKRTTRTICISSPLWDSCLSCYHTYTGKSLLLMIRIHNRILRRICKVLSSSYRFTAVRWRITYIRGVAHLYFVDRSQGIQTKNKFYYMKLNHDDVPMLLGQPSPTMV